MIYSYTFESELRSGFDPEQDDATPELNTILADCRTTGCSIKFGRSYRMNLLVAQDGVHLEGPSGQTYMQNEYNSFCAFDPNKPVLQFGDGKTFTRGGSVRNFALWGEEKAKTGLMINGARCLTFDNFAIGHFTGVGLDVNSASEPSTYLNFAHFFITAGKNSLSAVRLAYGKRYTTAVRFINGAISSVQSGAQAALILDSVRASLSQVYIQCNPNAGVKMTGASSIAGWDTNIDCGTANSIVLELPNAISAGIDNFLCGFITVNGVVKHIDGAGARPYNGAHLPYESVLNGAIARGPMGQVPYGTPEDSSITPGQIAKQL